MTDEDEEFNRIEREAKQRMEAVKSTCRTTTPEHIKQIIKPWVGLTDEEMLTLEETTTCTKDESWLRNLTRAIEAKLQEKNT